MKAKYLAVYRPRPESLPVVAGICVADGAIRAYTDLRDVADQDRENLAAGLPIPYLQSAVEVWRRWVERIGPDTWPAHVREWADLAAELLGEGDLLAAGSLLDYQPRTSDLSEGYLRACAELADEIRRAVDAERAAMRANEPAGELVGAGGAK